MIVALGEYRRPQLFRAHDPFHIIKAWVTGNHILIRHLILLSTEKVILTTSHDLPQYQGESISAKSYLVIHEVQLWLLLTYQPSCKNWSYSLWRSHRAPREPYSVSCQLDSWMQCLVSQSAGVSLPSQSQQCNKCLDFSSKCSWTLYLDAR